MKEPVPLTNWSIRLSEREVATWDDLLYALRAEVGNRALTKSDIFRSFVALADSPAVRTELVRELRQLPRRAS